MRRLIGLLALAVAIAFASTASAQYAQAYLNFDTTLLAGPSPDYPPIVSLPYGTYVTVYGCTAGWQWCDVSTGYDRGWVPGNYILYPYQGAPVLLPAYGARTGVPIVAFSIGVYWGAHYRHRPFYRDRNRWYSRPPPIARPPLAPPRPPTGWRPPPRPPQGGHRPPSGSHRPPPGGGQRPPNRPGSGQRPPASGSQRPPSGGGNRPGNQRPPQSGGSRPPAQGTRPAPQPRPPSSSDRKDRRAPPASGNA